MTIGVDTVMASGAGTSAAASKNMLGKEDFLLMLITQLRCQDPLSPMESTEFTAQLAQFSSLEQLQDTNERLENIQLYQASLNNSQAAGFIGKSVTAMGDRISLENGIAPEMKFALDGDAAEVSVNIYNENDELVKNIEAGSLSSGEQTVAWDMTDNNGNLLSDGIYRFEVMASDLNGEAINSKTFMSGKVTGIEFKNNAAYLVTDEQIIPMSSVLSISN